MSSIKLNLGCGDQRLDGYINCDLYADKVDMKFDAAKIPFDDNTVDEIAAYHLIEHFKFHQGHDILREWCRALKPGGRIILETPDFYNSCKMFVDADEQTRIVLYNHFFAWPHIPGQVHYFLFTESQLSWTLSECGFENITRILPNSIYAESPPPPWLDPDLVPKWKSIYLKMTGTKKCPA